MSVDVSESGEGQLEVIVECEGETIPCSIHQKEVGMLTAEFIPETGKPHTLHVAFNGDLIPGKFLMYTL